MSWGDAEARVIREMIKHEANVSNHRLTWLAALQGLLFAALGFFWHSEGAGSYILVLSVLGVSSSASSLYSLWLAHRATEEILISWNANKLDTYNGPPVIGAFVTGISRWFLPWFCLPSLLILAWSYFLLIALYSEGLF
ncbi:hypothetical protein LRB11_16925 [Ectothiorhodospira haloalkaliphila]|uniref:hypothetical protein n=1 Tax=Ectothiorhodospira haloalkaliphila TaxID=421628 RepID=UPI001EE92D92|nr:hypothetical protein [Ectothiorhodospira haloalkaliphila]MCG5526588.1 hypothetical protein [Ectothiorhodospira haloalkaliphila]